MFNKKYYLEKLLLIVSEFQKKTQYFLEVESIIDYLKYLHLT